MLFKAGVWSSKECISLLPELGVVQGGVAREIASDVLFLLPAMNSHLGRMAVRYCRCRTSLADSQGLALAAAPMRA